MKKIEKLNKVCNVLSTFVADHKGVLDDKTKGDLKALQDRVAAETNAEARARDEIAVARTGRDISFEKLQRCVLESKKAVEMVVIRDGKGVVVPRISVIINNPARIHILAGKYLKAVAQAGKDPVLVKAGANLQTALDGYVDLYNEAYGKVSSTSEVRKENAANMISLGGEVNAYRMLVAYRSPEDARRELFNRLKAALPRKSHKNGSDGKSDTASSTTTATTLTQGNTIPSLPSVPQSPKAPDTNEHPVLSATA